MSIIRLKDVHLTFKIAREKRIKDLLVPGDKSFSEFGDDGSIRAINNLSFTIGDHERVAIIGHNGAGKSTLLKVISGIYQPTSGEIAVEGTVSSMFELATGFEMEQSGWDNIYLRGLMLGETPESIKEKMVEIAEFSELGDFLEMPVKYYSSGMFVRLAFSISTAINPDILLLDEVVAAGDAQFLNKAKKRLSSMVDSSNIMVLVTHGMSDAVSLCNRCIWLNQGAMVMDGEPEEVTKAYIKEFVKDDNNSKGGD